MPHPRPGILRPLDRYKNSLMPLSSPIENKELAYENNNSKCTNFTSTKPRQNIDRTKQYYGAAIDIGNGPTRYLLDVDMRTESPPKSSSNRLKRSAEIACDQCFRTKLRCDGNQPICQECKDRDRPCTFSVGRKKSRSIVQRQRANSAATSKAPSSPVPSITRSSSLEDSLDFPSDPLSWAISPVPGGVISRDLLDHCEKKLQNTTPDSDIWEASYESAFGDENLPFASAGADAPLASLDPFAPSSNVVQLGQTVPTSIGKTPQAETTSIPATQCQQSSCMPTLGQTLALLHALNLDVKENSEGDGKTVTELQHSLDIVCAFLASADTSVEPSRFNFPTAMICSNIVRLVFACYFRMRERYMSPQMLPLSQAASKRPKLCYSVDDDTACNDSSWIMDASSSPKPTPINSTGQISVGRAEHTMLKVENDEAHLLHCYITRDMYLCQTLARRLTDCCRRLAQQSQETPSPQHNESVEPCTAIDAIITTLEPYTLIRV